MSRPSHTAFVVVPPKEGSDKKPSWYEGGVLWPHRSGKGFDLVIPEGMSLSGRIVILERKQAVERDEPSRTVTSAEFVEYLDERAAETRAAMKSGS